MVDFEVLSCEFCPIRQKNIWKIKYEDGIVEEKELPAFITRCLLCGNWINSKEKSVCPLGAKKAIKKCCDDCARKCKKKKICLLK